MQSIGYNYFCIPSFALLIKLWIWKSRTAPSYHIDLGQKQFSINALEKYIKRMKKKETYALLYTSTSESNFLKEPVM